MPSAPKTVSVIVATYNKPTYLRRALDQLHKQNRVPDQIIVADDGSGDETFAVCNSFPHVEHVWHPDNGFQKCEILNKALAACTSEYVIFIDDDCLCPPWFIDGHLNVVVPNAFTVGSSVNLSQEITELMLRGDRKLADFLSQDLIQKMKTVEVGTRGGWAKLLFRIVLTGTTLATYMDRIYLGRGVFRGGNSGAWVTNLRHVNGFNNDMVYGHEDREIGERLKNAGVKCNQVRYSAVNFHLHHKRPYADSNVKEAQREIYRKVRSNKIVACENGLGQVN